MLSKEVAVTLPLILWIYDLYFMKPGGGTERNTRQKGFLFSNARVYMGYLPFVFLVVIPYLMVRKVFFGSMVFHGSLADVWNNLITQTGVLTQYIQLLFFPLGLTIEHDIPVPQGFLNPGVIFSMVFLSALLFSAYYLYKKGGEWKIVSFFVLWFFIAILPTTVVPLNAVLQENRGYLPGVGFSFFAAFVLTRSRWSRRLSVFLLCLLISIYSLITFQRNWVWKNDSSLWEDAVSKAPGSPRAHDNLGLAYFNGRHYQEAEKEFMEAIRYHPQYFYAYYNLGVLYQVQGRWDEAIDHYRKAVEITPGFFRAYYNLGLAFKSKGDFEDAIRSYQKAIDIDSRYPFVYNNLGVIYYQNKRYPDAVQAFREAIDRDPTYVKAYYNLGNVYSELGDNKEAIAAYQAALRIQPEFENARLSLDRILQNQDRH
jgi:tetratricopeptide (TPR) repeat protein